MESFSPTNPLSKWYNTDTQLSPQWEPGHSNHCNYCEWVIWCSFLLKYKAYCASFQLAPSHLLKGASPVVLECLLHCKFSYILQWWRGNLRICSKPNNHCSISLSIATTMQDVTVATHIEVFLCGPNCIHQWVNEKKDENGCPQLGSVHFKKQKNSTGVCR